MSKSIKEVMDLIKNNKEMQKQYQEDPVNFLESNGVDTNNLPEEYLEKIAGGFVGAFLPDINVSLDLSTNNENSNTGNNNKIYNGNNGNSGCV